MNEVDVSTRLFVRIYSPVLRYSCIKKKKDGKYMRNRAKLGQVSAGQSIFLLFPRIHFAVHHPAQDLRVAHVRGAYTHTYATIHAIRVVRRLALHQLTLL